VSTTPTKRPCSICRRWFRADPRVGARQRTCSKQCKAELRKRTQSAWRKRNPEYGIARRLQERADEDERATARKPRPLERLPWDLVKDEFGAQRTGILEEFGRLLVKHTKDEIRAQAGGITRGIRRVIPEAAKDEIGAVAGSAA